MESDEEDYKAKEKAFYSAMISAWLNTRLERDKQLLSLSATAIGLLVTLLKTGGASSYEQIVLFAFAFIFFLLTIILVISILGENSTHIEKMLNESETENKKLVFLDGSAKLSFIIGIVLMVIIGIHSAVSNLNEKGIKNMSQEKLSNEVSIPKDGVINAERSFHGVAKLRPQPPQVPQSDTSPTANASTSSKSDSK